MFSNKYLNQEEIINLLSKVDEGYKKPSDPLFIECNKLRKQFKKLGVLTLVEESGLHSQLPVSCNIPGCNQVCNTVFEFETHYNALHRYLCSICKKNLPSAHLLDLHVSETHDSFFAAQAERQPMYSCFIAECACKSLNPEERKDHCIREHKFPSNFRFETCSSSSTSNGKYQRKVSDSSAMESLNEGDETIHESDTEKMGIKFFSFGHQRVKTFNSSKTKKTKNNMNKPNSNIEISPLEDEQMVTDLLESLPGNNC